MEKIENIFFEEVKKFESIIEIKIKDIENFQSKMANCFMKLQRQRERLESSRDMWKNKFMELKDSVSRGGAS